MARSENGLDSTEVEFNDKKVKAMIIKPRWKRDRKNDKVHTLDSVLYEDSKTRIVRRVEYVQEYRYFGAIINNRLTLTSWINKIAHNAK